MAAAPPVEGRDFQRVAQSKKLLPDGWGKDCGAQCHGCKVGIGGVHRTAPVLRCNGCRELRRVVDGWPQFGAAHIVPRGPKRAVTCGTWGTP